MLMLFLNIGIGLIQGSISELLIYDLQRTFNVPVVYEAQNVWILMQANPLQGTLDGWGHSDQDFLGPEIATSKANAI